MEFEDCSYCGEKVYPWQDEHEDWFTHICRSCKKEAR